ncbi:MAG: Coenzyme F420 hydrogenase/dehydrogenase, beta subunit C-terminal domain [Clostridia bacterium]|nr:Coenzyme F420 hydrogenase/dehydrogenase, beta subunit C-terminal domain [Clostridia bacterium]
MKICEKALCSGCGLCECVCPAGAINMRPDDEGFTRPRVDEKKCVGCGLCEKKCPVNVREKHLPIKAYAAYTKDDKIRKSSSSGGIFGLLASEVLRSGGVVAGAGFGEGLRVEHKITETEAGLKELMGSKYVQSNACGIYKSLGEYLKEGRTVLFSGTPCQCSAVRNLYKDSENLVVCDFICHGVPSPLVWERYVKEFPNAKAAYFRDKKRGWQEFSMRIDTSSRVYSCSQYKDPYLRIFLRNIDLRPSCYSCSWKGENYASDITLADFWGISKVYPEMNDDKGTSAVILRSKKGGELYSAVCERLFMAEVDASRIAMINTAYGESAMRPQIREEFFADLRECKDFGKLLKKYHKPISTTEIVKMRIKKTAKKLIGRAYRLKKRFR